MLATVNDSTRPPPEAPDRPPVDDPRPAAAPATQGAANEPSSFLMTLLRALGAIHS
jgi:hypothetical protein